MDYETKENVTAFRMQYHPMFRYGLWTLNVNGVTIAHGPKGKINAIMRLLNDSEIDVPEGEKAPVNNVGTTKTVVEMDYREFEYHVKETYGVAYEYACSEELNNYTSKTYDYSTKKPLDEYDAKRLAQFMVSKGDSMMIAHVLFQDMVNKGVLQPAEYLVQLSW